MRVSPAGFAFNTLDEVLGKARRSTEPSHSHPEGIKDAQAVASEHVPVHKGNRHRTLILSSNIFFFSRSLIAIFSTAAIFSLVFRTPI